MLFLLLSEEAMKFFMSGAIFLRSIVPAVCPHAIARAPRVLVALLNP